MQVWINAAPLCPQPAGQDPALPFVIENENVGNAPTVGVAVAAGVEVGVLVAVDVGVWVGVAVGVAVGVDVAVCVGVAVGVEVNVVVGVKVGPTGEFVGVELGVEV